MHEGVASGVAHGDPVGDGLRVAASKLSCRPGAAGEVERFEVR